MLGAMLNCRVPSHYARLSITLQIESVIIRIGVSYQQPNYDKTINKIVNFSIGVLADGTFDRELIARCMPHLETYEAVDIDPDALNHLKDVYSTTDYRVSFP